MTKKACCCGSCPPENWNCCKPWLRDQFVNIFDKWMDSAAPVSPSDLIVLRINRPESKNQRRIWTFRAGSPCHCDKTCCTPGCFPEGGANGPCENCQRTKACEDNQCVGGNLFAASYDKGDFCGKENYASCCIVCGVNGGGGGGGASLIGTGPLLGDTFLNTNFFNTKKSLLHNKLKTNVLTENITTKRLFTKPLNKFLKNPPSFKRKSNITSLEDLSEVVTKNAISKKHNFNMFNKNGTNANIIENYSDATQSLFLDRDESISGPLYTAGISTSNEIFRDQLKTLYPACQECLEANGYDIECIRNFNAPERCKNDLSYNKDFCEDCYDECSAFCNAYYGDTWQQKTNLANLQGNPVFNKNYEYLQGKTLLDPSVYLGMKVVTPRIRETMDPLRDSLMGNGSEYDLDTLQPTEQTLNESIYSFEPYDFHPEKPTATNPDLATIEDPLTSWNAKNYGVYLNDIDCGGGTSCDACPTGGGMPGAAPLYLIYRFTGCHIKWYPPEYIFNYEVKISQGQGYYHSPGQGDCEGFGFLGCDYYLRNNVGIINETGAEDNGADLSCYGNSSLNIGFCAKNGAAGTSTSFSECLCKDINLFPCQCYRYPHISGGIHDTVYKRFNMSQKRYQGGYIPKQNPFLPRMRVTAEEAGCMACYNSRDVSNVGQSTCTYYFDGFRASFSNYPKASGKGKSYPAIGAWCNYSKNCLHNGQLKPLYNPFYTDSCFNRGISPYLSRISKTLYQSAREIFHYGSVTLSQQPVLSVFYTGSGISNGVFGWNSINFRKVYNKKSNLFHKMVGLVGIEYHFECWAYHSSALFAPQPPIPMNHETALVTPFEVPYAGSWGAKFFSYDPREAFRYYATRHYPRRVIYASSTVPLFHSDLYAFEKISEYKNLKPFDATRFLEAFYLYFYNMLTDPGDTYWNEPVVTQSDVERYNYVSSAIEDMIFHNILSVKDHAKDIADELADMIGRVSAVFDVNTNEWVYIFPDEFIKAALGENDGLIELIIWCKNRINENVQNPIPEPLPNSNLIDYWNTYVKPNFTAKIVKAALINPGQASLPDYKVEYPIFAGPRRVKLWPTPQSAGLTAWGCEDSNYCENPDRRKSIESSLNTKTEITFDPNVGPVEIPFEYERLYSGQEVYFAITSRGKVRAFGKQHPCQISNDCTGGPYTEKNPIYGIEGFNRIVSIDISEGGEDPNPSISWFLDCSTTSNGTLKPCENLGVDAVPYHLSIASEAETAFFSDSTEVEEPFDGFVEKVVNKGKFAIALVSYNDGIVVGPNLYEGKPFSYTANFNLGYPNSNNQDTSLSYVENIRQINGLDPPNIQFLCEYIIPEPYGTQIVATHAFKWRQYSNSGWQVPSVCAWPEPPVLNGYPQINVIERQDGIMYPNSPTCLKESDIGQNYLTLKAWGETNYTKYGIFYQPNNQEGYFRQPTCYPQIDSRNLGSNTDNAVKRTNIANKYFIWHDIACGAKHALGILADGALYTTPESDNTFGQASYGFPTLDGTRVFCNTSLFLTTSPSGNFKENDPNYKNGISLKDSDTPGSPILWYYNYPKPSYFNDLTEEEWKRLLQRNLNNNQNIEILDPSTDDISKLKKYGYFRNSHCLRSPSEIDPLPSPNSNDEDYRADPKNYSPCDIRCHLFVAGNVTDELRMNPPNRPEEGNPQPELFLYGMCRISEYPSSWLSNYVGNYGGVCGYCQGAYGYECNERIPTDTPVWKNVAAGHYHSIALSTDNNLKIWGSYVKVDSTGTVIPGGETFGADNPIPVFLPVDDIFQDQWSLGGKTLGCGWDRSWDKCSDCDEFDSDCRRRCHQHEYFEVYTEATKTIFASKAIEHIDGGPDYSILARKSHANETPSGVAGYKLVVWGNRDMVTAVTGITYTGLTAIGSKYYSDIEKITAGPNSIAVLYKDTFGTSSKLDIFERYGLDTGVTGYKDISYTDVALTAGNAAALYAEGIRANTWDATAFDENTHAKIQFKNFANLPLYFRSQAFFTAVPGVWDFTKWIFGGPCQKVGSGEGTSTIVNTADPCSIYNIIEPEKNYQFSFSGHPQYYWMRGDWRRSSPVVPSWSYAQGPFQGCGLLRTRGGRDGLRPWAENGTGAIGGDYNSPMGNANRALFNMYGSCFNGDICWIGDGSFTPYRFVSGNPYAGSFARPPATCNCWDDACGCPISCKRPTVFACEPVGGFIGGIPCPFNGVVRAGFAGNKDYFVQSAKVFGQLPVNSNRGGPCCGCLNTNITAFFYAKRSNYYRYDESTGLYKVDCNPKPYRGCATGFTGSTPPNPLDTKAPAGSVKFIYDVMVPPNAINKEKFLIDNRFPYPPVYVGGRGNFKLEQILNDKFAPSDPSRPPCKSCEGPGRPTECILDNSCNEQAGLAQCQADTATLVGPGGWLHVFRPVSELTQSVPSAEGVVDRTSVYYNPKIISPSLLPSTADSLSPFVEIGPYAGPVPEEYRDCRYWMPKPAIQTAPGETPPCGCPQYPEGYCPGGAQECPGCIWKMKLGFCGGIKYDCNLFQINGVTGFDDLSAYFSEEFLPNLPMGVTPDNESQATSETWTQDVMEAAIKMKKAFRICAPLSNEYTTCGYTGPAIAFKGDISLGNVVGRFRMECDELGTIDTVQVNDSWRGLNYVVGDILTIESSKSAEAQARIIVTETTSGGKVTKVELVDPNDPLNARYGSGLSETKNLYVTNANAGQYPNLLQVDVTIKSPYIPIPRGYSLPVFCDPEDEFNI